MAITHLSSLVFVGGEFSAVMFDERALFDGNLDRGGQVKVGPIGQFSYLAGTRRFEVTPPRIDIKSTASEVMPENLVKSASVVAGVLQPALGPIVVNGFGMNCDTVLDKASMGITGVDFCSRLVNHDRLAELVDKTLIGTTTRMIFHDGAFRYDIRFEPEAASEGENMFVAINGHQAVSSGETLHSKFKTGQVQAFRGCVQALMKRIEGNR